MSDKSGDWQKANISQKNRYEIRSIDKTLISLIKKGIHELDCGKTSAEKVAYLINFYKQHKGKL